MMEAIFVVLSSYVEVNSHIECHISIYMYTGIYIYIHYMSNMKNEMNSDFGSVPKLLTSAVSFRGSCTLQVK
jgi:hypothetical protein